MAGIGWFMVWSCLPLVPELGKEMNLLPTTNTMDRPISSITVWMFLVAIKL